MKDIVSPLRKALLPALEATGESVYYQQADNDQTGSYIVFKVGTVTETNTLNGTLCDVPVDVTIYTEGQQYNSGDAADIIAAKVYLQLYPTKTHVLSMQTGFKMNATYLVNDVVNPWRVKNQVVAVDRVITFRYSISVQ